MAATTVRVWVWEPERHELGATLQRVAASRLGWGQVVAFEFVKHPRDADVVVAVAPAAYMRRHFGSVDPQLESLSVTSYEDPRWNQVFFHKDRWLHGPDAAVEVRNPHTGKPATGSRDRLYHYRTYLVNHELGHACGLPHAPPQDGVCSVMTQQTLHTHGARFNPHPSPRDLAAMAAARRRLRLRRRRRS